MRANRRRSRRYGIAPTDKLPVVLEITGADPLLGQMVNLSLGGLCARLPADTPPLEPGQHLAVRLPLGPHYRDLLSPCRVAHWRADPAGFFVGLSFLPVPSTPGEARRRRALAGLFVELRSERLERAKGLGGMG
jgi:hypothetical protein